MCYNILINFGGICHHRYQGRTDLSTEHPKTLRTTLQPLGLLALSDKKDKTQAASSKFLTSYFLMYLFIVLIKNLYLYNRQNSSFKA